MWTLLISFLIRSFSFFYFRCQFSTNESSLIKWRAKFLIFDFSDWLFWFLQYTLDSLNYTHFCTYKLKIKLILKLRKREDQALIQISKIIKFSAQGRYRCNPVIGLTIFLSTLGGQISVQPYVVFNHIPVILRQGRYRCNPVSGLTIFLSSLGRADIGATLCRVQPYSCQPQVGQISVQPCVGFNHILVNPRRADIGATLCRV